MCCCSAPDDAALAPLGVGLALIANLGFEIPLNVGQQWSALVHYGTDTTTLDAYIRSPTFVRGATYRVLRGGDGKLGLYLVLQAGGRLDSEMFPESMAIQSFDDATAYAGALCERHVDQILFFDTYTTARHTNEAAMIAALTRARVGGVRLRRLAGGAGWSVEGVDRGGCRAT